MEWKFNNSTFVIDKAPELPHELIKKVLLGLVIGVSHMIL